MSDNTAMLDVATVSERLNLSDDAVRRLCVRGEIQAIRLPGKRGTYRISEQALADFLAKNIAKPAPAPSKPRRSTSGRQVQQTRTKSY